MEEGAKVVAQTTPNQQRGRPRTYVEALKEDDSNSDNGYKTARYGEDNNVWDEESQQKFTNYQIIEQAQNAGTAIVGNATEQQLAVRAIEQQMIAMQATVEKFANRMSTMEKQIDTVTRETTELKGHIDKIDAQSKQINELKESHTQNFAAITAMIAQVLASQKPAGTQSNQDEESRGEKL